MIMPLIAIKEHIQMEQIPLFDLNYHRRMQIKNNDTNFPRRKMLIMKSSKQKGLPLVVMVS